MFDDWWNSYYDKLFYIADVDVDDLDVVMMIIDLTMSAMMTGILL